MPCCAANIESAPSAYLSSTVDSFEPTQRQDVHYVVHRHPLLCRHELCAVHSVGHSQCRHLQAGQLYGHTMLLIDFNRLLENYHVNLQIHKQGIISVVCTGQVISQYGGNIFLAFVIGGVRYRAIMH